MIARDDVKTLADLARLELSDSELDRYAHDLEQILGYVEQLRDVDVTGVEPTSQVTGLMNVLREDAPDDEVRVTAQAVSQFAPSLRDGYLVVPQVLDKGDE